MFLYFIVIFLTVIITNLVISEWHWSICSRHTMFSVFITSIQQVLTTDQLKYCQLFEIEEAK